MIRRVAVGDVIRTEPLNSIIQELSCREQNPGAAIVQSMPANICVAVNDTGRDLLFGEAAQLGELEISDYRDFLVDSSLRLVAPNDAYTAASWVVAAEDIPAGEAGRVFESGIFPARMKYGPDNVLESNFYAEFVVHESEGFGSRQDWWHLAPTGIGTARLLYLDNRKQSSPDDDDWVWGIIRYGGYSYLPMIYEITYVDPQREYVLAVPYIESGGGSGLPARRFDLPWAFR